MPAWAHRHCRPIAFWSGETEPRLLRKVAINDCFVFRIRNRYLSDPLFVAPGLRCLTEAGMSTRRCVVRVSEIEIDMRRCLTHCRWYAAAYARLVVCSFE